MKTAFILRGATAAILLASSIGVAAAQTTGPIESTSPDGSVNQQLALTFEQKSAILKAVGGDKMKTAHIPFSATVGAAVPPSVNLYMLPDQAMNNAAAAKLYQFTIVQGDVVIVDPIQRRVVEVIRKFSN
jgi:hypothetical protein